MLLSRKIGWGHCAVLQTSTLLRRLASIPADTTATTSSSLSSSAPTHTWGQESPLELATAGWLGDALQRAVSPSSSDESSDASSGAAESSSSSTGVVEMFLLPEVPEGEVPADEAEDCTQDSSSGAQSAAAAKKKREAMAAGSSSSDNGGGKPKKSRTVAQLKEELRRRGLKQVRSSTTLHSTANLTARALHAT